MPDPTPATTDTRDAAAPSDPSDASDPSGTAGPLVAEVTTRRRRRLALVVLLAALFMDMVDSTIVSIALPHIQRDLGSGAAAAPWVLSGYTMAFGLGLISGGRLGDSHGRKRVFLLGTILFTLASVLCGAAPDVIVLILARIAQGVGAAIMVPQVLAAIVAMYRAHERAGAFAWYGVVLSLGNVSGPVLGGLLMRADLFGLGWRAVFYVNIPIGLLTILGALRFLPESRAERPLRLDLTGALLLAAGMSVVLLPLMSGPEVGWPGWLLGLGVSMPILALFARQQRRRDRTDGSALLPPILLRCRNFVVGTAALLVMFTGLASIFLVLTYHLQLGLGWSPVQAAMAAVSWPLGITLTSPIARRLAGSRPLPLIAGGLLGMAGCTVVLIGVLRTVGESLQLWQVALPVFAIGLGMGLCVSTLTGLSLVEVPAEHAGAASGVANAAQQLGAAVGVAIVGLLYFTSADRAGADVPPAEATATAASSALSYNAAVFAVAALAVVLLRGAGPARSG